MNIIEILKKLLLFIGFIGLLGIFLIIQKTGTTGCYTFNVVYWGSTTIFIASAGLSYYLYIKLGKIHITMLVPFVFIVMFLSLYLSYRYDRIGIYDQYVSGDSYINHNYCDSFFIKLLSIKGLGG